MLNVVREYFVFSEGSPLRVDTSLCLRGGACKAAHSCGAPTALPHTTPKTKEKGNKTEVQLVGICAWLPFCHLCKRPLVPCGSASREVLAQCTARVHGRFIRECAGQPFLGPRRVIHSISNDGIQAADVSPAWFVVAAFFQVWCRDGCRFQVSLPLPFLCLSATPWLYVVGPDVAHAPI